MVQRPTNIHKYSIQHYMFSNYILELKIDTLSHSVLFKYW